MPVDKFGRMSDTKTKDTGVSLTYINNNYSKTPLLRPPLVLLKFGLISGVV